jgi:hypothetical protein
VERVAAPRGAQAGVDTFVAAGRSPAEGRKVKIGIDVSAAGARALGPFLHGPSPQVQQPANCVAFIKSVLRLWPFRRALPETANLQRYEARAIARRDRAICELFSLQK